MPGIPSFPLVPLMALVPVLAVWTVAAVALMDRPWLDTPMNPGLAIDRGDFAQAIRTIEAGAPVSAAYPDPTPQDPARHVTPLDEAIRAGEPDLVRVLLDLGALPDPDGRRRAACRALAAGARDIATALVGGDVPAGDCPPVPTVRP